ncbi:MAG TPA: peptidylprolyl isomerase [Vicinamibacterales bacterium]|nr:peptidylprolyl isomerase [Vicinamibacterales bacterium]
MTKRVIVVAWALAAAVAVVGAQAQRAGQPPAPAAGGTTLVLETVKGTIEIELFDKEAPKSIDHILALVRRGFYRGLRVHWWQAGLIQFGDPASRDMAKQSSWGEGGSGQRIGVAEFNKKPFERGSVGVAFRSGQTSTDADSQIFICKAASPHLNGKYTMIGKVTKGIEVADKLELADIIKLVYVKGETPK